MINASQANGRAAPVSGNSILFNERYKLGALLGSGMSGLVFRAIDRRNGREVAIKCLSLEGDEELRTRFLREVELLERLRHPNIVQFVDAGEFSNIPYLVMEYLDGGSLRSRLEHAGRIPVPTAVSWVAQCLTGLELCHRTGIIHRDIKPENVLLTGSGIAKLADLGIAKEVPSHSSLTGPGNVLGSIRYMAPEQIRGEPLTASSDIYAVGILLYELLTGYPPFQAATVTQLCNQHLFAAPKRLANQVPDIPQALEEVLRETLAKSPRHRPRSAAELADRLCSAMSGRAARTPAKRPESSSGITRRLPRLPPRWRWWLLALLLLILGLAGLWLPGRFPNRVVMDLPSRTVLD